MEKEQAESNNISQLGIEKNGEHTVRISALPREGVNTPRPGSGVSPLVDQSVALASVVSELLPCSFPPYPHP